MKLESLKEEKFALSKKEMGKLVGGTHPVGSKYNTSAYIGTGSGMQSNDSYWSFQGDWYDIQGTLCASGTSDPKPKWATN